MKKLLWILAFVVISILAIAVFVGSSDLPDGFEEFIINIAEQRGINITNETNVTQVNFDDLPDQINLENIDNTNLGLYQIDMGVGQPVYVLTMSDATYTQTQNVIEDIDLKRSYLNFGKKGKASNSEFLETATGVKGSLEKGYVMMRAGSITGISTNLEISKDKPDSSLEIIIYKNGEALGLGNTLIASSKGVKTDYDIQSENTITFEAGDVISVYVETEADLEWKEIITMVEITTSD